MAQVIKFKYQNRNGSIQIANNGEVFVAWATVTAQLSGFVPKMREFLEAKIRNAGQPDTIAESIESQGNVDHGKRWSDTSAELL